MMQYIIFTDLDGTLLDDNYSFDEAKEALKVIKSKNVPLVLCSSKSKSEMEYWQDKLGIKDAFIVENGGAIVDDDEVISLGTDINELKSVLNEIDPNVKGLSSMSVSEVMEITGLPEDQVEMAKKKKYTEAFLTDEVDKIKSEIEARGYVYTRAKRFHYIMKGNDKGKAVKILIDKFKEKYGSIVSVGLGDNENDKPMLDVVDKPFLLKNGPKEWNEIVLNFIKN